MNNNIRVGVIFFCWFLTGIFVHGNECQPGQDLYKHAKGRLIVNNYGLIPDGNGKKNQQALQAALDIGGVIHVERPGVYPLAGTVYIGSNTELRFGKGVFLKKVVEQEDFSHVILNKGALTRTYDHNISIHGLNLMVNGVDSNKDAVYGLRGHVAFFYVKNIEIDGFRCVDMGNRQFCLQICTFEDLRITNAIIKGHKDGIHLGRGKRFTIRDCVFQTGDDAIALNAFDYATANPELGWIEDGVIENCHDLRMDNAKYGFFIRYLSGGWRDWKPGMEVQNADTVVSDGRLYRVWAKSDGMRYKSVTQPKFCEGKKTLDDIPWGVIQSDVMYTAGVRNVSVRDVFLTRCRTAAFAIFFDNSPYCRSYYPGAPLPIQENLSFNNVNILYDEPGDLFEITAPVDIIRLMDCQLRNTRIAFYDRVPHDNTSLTTINLRGCSLCSRDNVEILFNQFKEKPIIFKASESIILNQAYFPKITTNEKTTTIKADFLNK